MKKCDTCGKKFMYDMKYDSYYCVYCEEWKESKCNDTNCYVCMNRPEKPIQKKPDDGIPKD